MSDDGNINTSSTLLCNSSIANCSSSEEPWDYDYVYYIPLNHWVICVIIVVCCLLGIPGNIVVIVKLVRQRHRSNMTKSLFLHLAVCDLLTLLCTVGLATFTGLHGYDYLFHHVNFFYSNFFYVTNHNIVLLMSVQRYYQVLHPQKWDRLGQRGERGLLVGMWLVAAVLTLPKLFALIPWFTWDVQKFIIILEVVNILFIIISFSVLVTFYVRLLRGVNQTAFFNDSRTTKLIILIVTIFLICSIPPLVIRTLFVCGVADRSLLFVFGLYLINSGLDPFLYFFASRSRRRGRGDTERPIELTPRDPPPDLT